MGSIELVCRCGKQFHVSQAALGKSGRCPSCQCRLRLIAPGFRAGEDRLTDRLVMLDGPEHKGDQFLLGGPGPIEIGKLPGKTILLNGQQVSRTHCRLVRCDEGWRVEDQRSSNGTFVNDARVADAELYDGDTLTIGEYVLRFHGRPRPVAAAEAEAEAPALEDASGGLADLAGGMLGDDLYALAEGEAVEAPPLPSAVADGRLPPPPPETGGPTCPSCERSLAPNAKICVFCGIDLKTGRAILTSDEGGLDGAYAKAESIIPWLSWVIPFGIYPIASEALGTRKPYVVRALAILTILTTVWFWSYEWSDSPKMRDLKNYLLWTGNGKPRPELLYHYYTQTSYGNREAFLSKLEELQEKTIEAHKKRRVSQDEEEDESVLTSKMGEMVLAAHNALPPEDRCLGQYHAYQLITNAFLHADIWHIAGNLLFLMVFGSRVNALLGNVATIVLYPLLAVLAGLAHMASEAGSPPMPSLGASGAIMGLAGLYLALMPFHKVHMATWWRLGLMWGFRLNLKIFPIKGIWVVLFYISFDVFYTLVKIEHGVAHWAHLGGLLAGLGIGLALLLTRVVSSHGGDLLSGLLGQQAWALVGKPNPEKKPLLQRLP